MSDLKIYAITVNDETFGTKQATSEEDAIHQTEQQIRRLTSDNSNWKRWENANVTAKLSPYQCKH